MHSLKMGFLGMALSGMAFGAINALPPYYHIANQFAAIAKSQAVADALMKRSNSPIQTMQIATDKKGGILVSSALCKLRAVVQYKDMNGEIGEAQISGVAVSDVVCK